MPYFDVRFVWRSTLTRPLFRLLLLPQAVIKLGGGTHLSKAVDVRSTVAHRSLFDFRLIESSYRFQSPLQPAQGQVATASTSTQVSTFKDAEKATHLPSAAFAAPLRSEDIPAAMPSGARQVSGLSMSSAFPEPMQVSSPCRSPASFFHFKLGAHIMHCTCPVRLAERPRAGK
jgi:hypothetical protein